MATTLTPAQRQKLSESKRGKKNPMYGTPGPGRKMWISRDELHRLYVEEGWSKRRLTEHLGISGSALSQWLRRYDIRLSDEEARRRQGIGRTFEGRRTLAKGYCFLLRPNHPYSSRDGYVCEHRLVVEGIIGRPVAPQEQVHHVNMLKHDNRPENLILFPSSRSHNRFHKYVERVGIFLLGLGNLPAPFTCESQMLWRGDWVEEIDLMRQLPPP